MTTIKSILESIQSVAESRSGYSNFFTDEEMGEYTVMTSRVNSCMIVYGGKPMTKIDQFVLAENFILDQAGRMSFINMYDQLNTTEDSIVAPKFVIVLAITPSKGDVVNSKLKFKIEILKPDGSELFKLGGEGEVPKGEEGNRVVSSIDLSGQLKFDQAGEHTVKLLVQNKDKAQFHFNVNLNQKDPR